MRSGNIFFECLQPVHCESPKCIFSYLMETLLSAFGPMESGTQPPALIPAVTRMIYRTSRTNAAAVGCVWSLRRWPNNEGHTAAEPQQTSGKFLRLTEATENKSSGWLGGGGGAAGGSGGGLGRSGEGRQGEGRGGNNCALSWRRHRLFAHCLCELSAVKPSTPDKWNAGACHHQ